MFLGYHGTSRAALRHLAETPYLPGTFFTTYLEHASIHARDEGLCHLFAPRSELEQSLFLIPQFMAAEFPCSSTIDLQGNDLLDQRSIAFVKVDDTDALVLYNPAGTKVIQICQDLGVYTSSISAQFSYQSIWSELQNRDEVFCF